MMVSDKMAVCVGHSCRFVGPLVADGLCLHGAHFKLGQNLFTVLHRQFATKCAQDGKGGAVVWVIQETGISDCTDFRPEVSDLLFLSHHFCCQRCNLVKSVEHW